MSENPPTYYNTNYLREGDLHAAKKKAKSQEDRVLEFFENNPRQFIKAEIINDIILKGCHRGTVSRCLTNLTEKGHLKKCSHFGKSRLSKKVHTWVLKPNDNKPVQTELF